MEQEAGDCEEEDFKEVDRSKKCDDVYVYSKEAFLLSKDRPYPVFELVKRYSLLCTTVCTTSAKRRAAECLHQDICAHDA